MASIHSQSRKYQDKRQLKRPYNDREESLEYTISANDSSSGGCITGNFGGTFSDFKMGTDGKRSLSTFKCTKNVEKLIKRFDVEYGTSFQANTKSQKDSKSRTNKIQSHVILIEEEKRMKDEKLKIAENVNNIFRMYDKVYSKVAKKKWAKKEAIKAIKKHSKTKKTMILFEQLWKNIASDNPNNAIGLIKLWNSHERTIQDVCKNLVQEKKETADTTNRRINEIIMECNNLFTLLDHRNQDILGLIDYASDMRETIDTVRNSV